MKEKAYDIRKYAKKLIPVDPEEKISYENRKHAIYDADEHLRLASKASQLRKEHDASQEKAEVKIQTNLSYVLIVGWGDWHLGSQHCDYDLFNKHRKLIRDTPGVYAVMVGDERDNFVIDKFKSGMYEAVLQPEEQAMLAKGVLAEMDKANKILARTSGNHDNWTWDLSGVNLDTFWYEGMKSPLLRSGGFVHLKLNKTDYIAYLHHGKSIFNSNFNPNHATKRAFEFQGPYDMAFMGHVHVAETAHSWRWTDEFTKDYVQVRTGTYKTDDPYAKSRQLGRGQYPGACVLVSTTDKRMMPFLKIEDGVESMKAMNAYTSLVAQGLLGIK